MTYKQDPKRKQAAKWHDLLNNGVHWIAQDSTGRIHAQGHSQHAPTIKAAMRFRPDLQLIKVDDQI